jgi:hypothetical protein
MEDTMGNYDFLEPIPKTSVQVKLPSRGVPYPKGTAMEHGKLTITPMTMVEEAMFANPRSAGGDAVDKILKRCTMESLDINTLLSSDKFFLFMMLRAVTYGPEYSFTWTCPARPDLKEMCGHKNEATVRIPDDFEVKYLADEDIEPFTVRLPECGREISFRLFRGYDEPEVEKHGQKIENQQKQGIDVADTTEAFRVVRHITAVDGKSVEDAPADKVMAFVLSLPSKDSQVLQEKINYYTPGISTDVALTCSSCGTVQNWDLPFTANFFRAVNPSEGGSVGDEVRPDVPPRDEVRGDHEAGPSGTAVVLPKAAGDEGPGERIGKTQTRSTPPRRVGRAGKIAASE